MGKKVKTNVRLIRATEAIWMCLSDEDRKREWKDCLISDEGYTVKIWNGIDRDGDPTYATIQSDWEGVATELDMDKCEHVKNPDGIDYVLMYDEEAGRKGKDK